jgi:Do/DeqQ family serine protease
MAKRLAPILALGALLVVSQGVGAEIAVPPTGSEMPSLAPMLEKVIPGVVSIAVHGKISVENNPLLSDPFFRRFFGLPEGRQPQEQEFRAAGSGVVVDSARGYIMTNNHVVEKADDISVALSDGRRLKARKIGADAPTDLAVVQVEPERLTGLPLGDSDKLRVGDYVVAVGNPFGLGQTATMGIVSALGRTGLGIEGYEDFIQTDASINPGNSGGPLVNLRGEVVGINSAIIAPSGGNVGIGFAIPINMARAVMEELIAHGEVRRGQLGVLVQDFGPDLAKAMHLEIQQGALVSEVLPGSAAEKASIQAGDVITELNGQRVLNAQQLRNRIGLLPVGSEVALNVVRESKTLQVKVVLAAERTTRLVIPADIPLLATVELGDVGKQTAPEGREGAVVLKLDKNSPAAKAGLLAGDVIVGVNQQPVRSPEDVVALAAQNKDQVLLKIRRNGGMRFIVVS